MASTITRFIELGAEFKAIRSLALTPLVLNERDDIVVMEPGGAGAGVHIAAALFVTETAGLPNGPIT